MRPVTPKRVGIIIFCDGASSGNPGPGGWGAIVAARGKVRELGGGEAKVTNNQMELRATIEALKLVARIQEPVKLHTDSKYVIQGITQWIWGWRKKGWKTATGTPVANVELWQELSDVVSKRGKPGVIEWLHVRGHAGVPGNERADQIAVAFSKRLEPSLYEGELRDYGISLEETGVKIEKDSKRSAKAAPSKTVTYLSWVGSTVMRHKTWPACESRVKGVPGAKFKKASSPEEESEILKAWGIPGRPIQD